MQKKYIEQLKNELEIDGWFGSTEKLESIINRIEKEISIERFLELSKIKSSTSRIGELKLNKIFDIFKEEVLKYAVSFKYYSYNERSIKIIFFNGPDDEFIEYVFHSIDDLYSKPYMREGVGQDYVLKNIVIDDGKFIYVEGKK